MGLAYLNNRNEKILLYPFLISLVFHICMLSLFLNLANHIETDPQPFIVDLISVPGIIKQNDPGEGRTKARSKAMSKRFSASSPNQSFVESVPLPSELPPSIDLVNPASENPISFSEQIQGIASPVDIKGSASLTSNRKAAEKAADLGGSTRGNSTVSLYLSNHFSYIRDIIQQSAVYPSVARKMGWQGRAILSFVILKNGTVKDLRILESSGKTLLDNSATKAVIETAPFPRPPIEAHLIIPVSFKLN